MKKNKRFTVHVKRKRTKKTNYAKRLENVKSQKTRLVIRPHANNHEAILDTGLHKSSKGSRIYAALKGVIDAGIHVPHSEEILPDKETIEGKKIENYAKILSQSQNEYKRQFSSYLKNNTKPEEISKKFEEVKSKIIK